MLSWWRINVHILKHRAQQKQQAVLRCVGVCKCGRQHGERVRKDDHAGDDGDDHGHKITNAVTLYVTVAGGSHRHDGEVQRRHVALAR